MIGNIIMISVGLTLVYLGIYKKMEPLLLIPIGLGAILVNLPGSELGSENSIFGYFLKYLIHTEIAPLLIFLGLGALTDFSPVLANPKTFLLGAAAQIGIFAALLSALFLGFSPQEAASIGIIGGADGPTTIYTTTILAPHLLAATAVAAYSYMSLVPIIQPPIIKALTSREERMIRMRQLRVVSKKEKIAFPIVTIIVTGIVAPKALPLIGMLMVGNLFRESGVTDRLAKGASEELMNIMTIILGLTIGSTMRAESFLTQKTILVLILGILAFAAATGGGVILAKFMNIFLAEKINPMIGAAGVSAVPMSARVVQKLAIEEDPQNHILMHAMGPNVAGVIGSAVVAGILISLLG
ncbi:MAG TPA: sodium ion-translocating decarboxylase subunit beta [Archaeoglobus sp.]|nr:sodium ion-translocating decarboxylase subunit beta [Archaeoglobus sp.]